MTCVTSVRLSQEQSVSRASACINSLRLISETPPNITVRRPGSDSDDIHAIVEYLEPLCYHPSTALRASYIRALLVWEFVILFADLDAETMQTMKFPDHLIPLFKAITATTKCGRTLYMMGR
jgi:hypothetical protein